jgi:non-heme chloroperoxidase
MEAMTMPFLETDDHTRLFYQEWGPGEPVLFVHGWAMGADMWEYQMLDLSDRGFRPIAYDQRGCGRSDQPGRGYDFNTYADDLATLIEHLDLRNLALVAYSLGGGMVARYLSRHGSGRIAKVALVSSTTPYLLKADDNPEGMDRGLVYDGFLAGLLADRPQLVANLAAPFFGLGRPGIAISTEMVQWATQLCLRSSARGMIDLYRVSCESDLRSDMNAFTMPTLVIHGDADMFAPLDVTARRTARAIPGSRLEVYENAAHGLFLTHRERLSRDLLAFIETESEVMVTMD